MLPDDPTARPGRVLSHLIALQSRTTTDFAGMCRMSGRHALADELDTIAAQLARIAHDISAEDARSDG